MSLSWREVADRIAIAVLDEDRRRIATYVLIEVFQPRDTIPVGRDRVHRQQPIAVGFVDLEPGANWGHPCRYILVDLDTGTTESINQSFPPPPAKLRLLHRGDDVATWMLLSEQSLSE